MEDGWSPVCRGMSVKSTSVPVCGSLGLAWPGRAAFLLIFLAFPGGACLCTRCCGVVGRGEEDKGEGWSEGDGACFKGDGESFGTG